MPALLKISSLLVLLLLAAAAGFGNAISIDKSHSHCTVRQFEYEEHKETGIKNCFFSPRVWHLIHRWCRDLPQNRQSPIAVNLTECRRDARLAGLWLSDAWYSPQEFFVYNNGFTLKAVPASSSSSSSSNLTSPSSSLQLLSSSLPQQKQQQQEQELHEVVQLHLHWGSSDSMLQNGTGSEHRLLTGSSSSSSSRQQQQKELPTSAELHIVTARTGVPFSQAALVPDAITVLAVFLQVAQNKSENATESLSAGEAAMQALLQDLDLLRTPRSGHKDNSTQAEVSRVKLRLRDLLPRSLSRMVAYGGSLTTPTCNPVVQWRLFPDPMPIRAELLTQLTALFYDKEHKRPMINNYRPIMQRHNRRISCTFDGRV